jgi:2-amino-4-hydroxy-6-hydroxymethyldihydropteridine diphosphokinase
VSETVFIGLGSNLGDRERFLSQALNKLRKIDGLEITAMSAIYDSPAQGMPVDTPPFLNQVVRGECACSPEELLDKIEHIETDLGRTGKGELQARTIDLDILMFGAKRIETDRLEVPHPRMLKRAFVLVPLLEIEPTLEHPATGKKLSHYLTAAFPAQLEVYRNHVARQV